MTARGLRGMVKTTTSRIDSVQTDALVMTATTVALAGFGALFWIIAGHLQTIEAVGVAGTLITATVVLAHVAQLGLDRALVVSLPTSQARTTDIAFGALITGVLGFLLGLVFALVTPLAIPAVAGAVHGSRALGFGVLVAGTSVNLTTDSIFLALRRLGANFVITGVGMGVAKCVLLFAFTGFGAAGVVAAVGVSSILSAALCVACCVRAASGDPEALPRRWPRPSPALVSATRVGVSSYVSILISFVPSLLLPILILRGAGAAENGAFFVAMQIVTALYSAGYAVSYSAYAQAWRTPAEAPAALRRGAHTMAVILGAGGALLVIGAQPLLSVFGHEYADRGVATLRWLAVAAVPLGIETWCGVVLRVRLRLSAGVLISVVKAFAAVAAELPIMRHGAIGGALSWLAAETVSALLGLSLVLQHRRSR